MAVQLIIDVRERKLVEELKAMEVPFSTMALEVGDILIQNVDGSPLLVAERKSHPDFASSLLDGRYREQRARLMATRGQGVAVLYMLEGMWTTNLDFTYPGCTEVQLQRLTSRLILRYGMPVLQTRNVKETAQWCKRLLDQLTDDQKVFHPEGIAAETTAAMSTYTATFSTVKKGNKTAGSVAVGMLSAVPGLGLKRVTALLEVKSIADLCTMTMEDIAALSVGGKKLGTSVATSLKDALMQRG